MKKFTVKDFIFHNSPCFSCGNQISVNFIITTSPVSLAPVSLKPLITRSSTSIDLQITYTSTLTLSIDHKTNKFVVNDTTTFAEYLQGHKLALRCYCDRCDTSFSTFLLEFSPVGFVRPVGICEETIVLFDRQTQYAILSSYLQSDSILIVSSLKPKDTYDPVQMTLPLLPRYKFKDREQLLNKLKTYMIFS